MENGQSNPNNFCQSSEAWSLKLVESNLEPSNKFCFLSEANVNGSLCVAADNCKEAGESCNDWVMMPFARDDDPKHNQKQSCTAWHGDDKSVSKDVCAVVETCEFKLWKSSEALIRQQEEKGLKDWKSFISLTLLIITSWFYLQPLLWMTTFPKCVASFLVGQHPWSDKNQKSVSFKTLILTWLHCRLKETQKVTSVFGGLCFSFFNALPRTSKESTVLDLLCSLQHQSNDSLQNISCSLSTSHVCLTFSDPSQVAQLMQQLHCCKSQRQRCNLSLLFIMLLNLFLSSCVFAVFSFAN